MSSETYVDEAVFYEMNHKTDSFSYGDWTRLVKENHLGKYDMLPVELQGDMTLTTTYIRPFPTGTGASTCP